MSIELKVKDCILQQFGGVMQGKMVKDPIDVPDDLEFSDFGVCELDLMELAMAVEEKLGIELCDTDIEDWKNTVNVVRDCEVASE